MPRGCLSVQTPVSFLAVYVLVSCVILARVASQSQTALASAEYPGKMDTRIMNMLAALCFNILCLFIRANYRTIELSDGWNGRIINTEVYFNVLDSAIVVLAMYTLNFAHPGPWS
ncbi:hypothetical protein CPB85DRAFT_1529784 [Mucidula mucida]|nr:hypothetical protein CPB85DRAFT_1529784 [Mucidula mucida]